MSSIQKRMPQLQAMSDSELFEHHIREYAEAHPGTLRILEAGCGRRWSLDLTGVSFRLIGVDLNTDAMRMRTDLDEAVVGDLRDVTLPIGSCDVVYSAFVLEHVAGAEQVLDRMIAAIRPGGLLLLRIPDRDSVFGFFTRHSPYWLHVQYIRKVRGGKLAGTPGRGPFPTVYDPVVSWQGITAYCEARALQIIDAHASNQYLDAFGWFSGITDRALRVVAALSHGRLIADYNNLALVIQKPDENTDTGGSGSVRSASASPPIPGEAKSDK